MSALESSGNTLMPGNPKHPGASIPNLRMTPLRRLILDVFADESRPMTIEEILAAASSRANKIGMATVYRTVNQFEQAEVIEQVLLPGLAARYELRSQLEHPHFVCELCEKAFCLDPKAISMKLALPQAYEVRSRTIILYGNCETCA